MTDIPYARRRFEQATELLSQVHAAPGAADGVVDRYFKAHRNMGAKDRRHAADTVYGCLRRQREGRAIINGVFDAADGQENTEATSMEVAVYLLRHGHWPLDAFADTPVAERVQRLGGAIQGFEVAQLAAAERLNLPDWLYETWLSQLGADGVQALVEALNLPARIDIRVNRRVADRHAMQASLMSRNLIMEAGELSADCLFSGQRGPLQNTLAFRQGGFEMQDEGSQLIGWLLQPAAGETLVDYCAGAGGKTVQIADLMGNTGALLACDIASKRLQQLGPRLARARLSNVTLQPLNEAGVLSAGMADGVLVDAPCSGTGTLRRAPGLKWRDMDLMKLQQQQLAILTAASDLVRPGGRLVYATCSLVKAENEDVVDQFLSACPEFERAGITPTDDPTWALLSANQPALAQRLRECGALQLWPHIHGTDGFYAQYLRRRA